MTMYDASEKLRKEFEELFKDRMTVRQIWWIIKMMKAARLYCRSNVAFNNFANAVFRGTAEFRQVRKIDKYGKEYMGLSIILVNPDGTFAEASSEEHEEI